MIIMIQTGACDEYDMQKPGRGYGSGRGQESGRGQLDIY